MKKFTSILAVALSLLMILCSLPFSAFAAATNPNQSPNPNAAFEKIGNATEAADASDVSGHQFKDGISRMSFTKGENNPPSVASTKTPDGSMVKELILSPGEGVTATADMDYGYAIDIHEPTINAVNGMAIWVDFSEFAYDDYWRPYTVDNTVVTINAFNGATNAKGAGSHYAYTYGRATTWTATNKNTNMTLINTETGEVEVISRTAGNAGGYKIPAGFVGYAYFEFDNKSNSVDDGTAMSNVGAFIMHRRWNARYLSSGTDETTENRNKISKNLNSKYYFGDVYAVSDIDKFVADVISGKLGKLASTGCGAAVEGTTVTVDAVDGAVKYVATALDEANGNALYDYAESDTTNLTFTKDVAGKYVQVVALDAEGNQLKVVSTHNIVTDSKEPTVAEDGYTKKQCSICKKVFEETTIPAIGYVGEINGMNSVDQVIRGYNGPIQFATYSVENAYTGVTPYGPSLKYTLQQLWPGGAVAVALDLEGADGFAFYMDVGGAQYYADSLASKAHTAVNNYFDIGFGSSLHANFGTDDGLKNIAPNTIRGTSTGTVPEGAVIPVIGGWGASRNSGFTTSVIQSDNYNITFKLYDVKTRTLTDGTYNMTNASGSSKPRAEMVIPANFTGYVIVDLTNYNNDAYASENNPPAIDDIKQIYIERTNDLKVVDADGNEYINGEAKVGYDNFFAIYDVAGMTASKAAFEEIISEFSVAYPKADSVFEVGSGDDAGNVGFRVENFTPVSYRIYRPNTSNDTLILQDTIPATTDDEGNYTYHAEEGNIDYVQAIDAEGNASPVAVVDALCYHEWVYNETDGNFICSKDECDGTVYIELDGGSIDANGTADTTTGLIEPTKEGYYFVGWYTDADFTTKLTYSAQNGNTYYAKWEFNGDKIGGYTITLGADIGVNFYMELTDDTLADETAYMLFTLPNGSTSNVYVKDSQREVIMDKTYYKFSCGVAVKEMTSDIKAQLFTANGNTTEYTYTVEEYALYIIGSSNYNEKEKALANALLNYGASAQTMFKYKQDALANRSDSVDKTIANVEASTLASYEKNVGAAIDGITYLGTSTIWETKTTIRHYFDISGDNITFKLYNGDQFVKDLTVEYGTYGKYIAIDGIVAKDMKSTYTVVISNGSSTQDISYSVYSYFYDILNNSTNYSTAELDAIKAAYHYSQAAIDYLLPSNG